MQLDAVIDGIADDLNTLAALGDPAAAAAGQRLLSAMAPLVRLRLLDVLGQAAAELSVTLPEGHVELRLTGGDPTFAYMPPPESPAAPPAADDLSARLTLRLPDSLKDAIERAADASHVSVNGWVVAALKRAVHEGSGPRRGPGGRRLTGYGQS